MDRIDRTTSLVFASTLLLAAACGLAAPHTGHTISGTVSGEVKNGATITLTGTAGAVTTTSGSSGSYAFGSVADGVFTITAALPGYVFAPESWQQVTVAGADLGGKDFHATATHHGIRGTISGLQPGGVQVFLTGASTATTTTAADGTYAFASVANGTSAVTPVRAGYGFSPGKRTVLLAGGDAIGQDFVSSLNTTPLHAIPGAVTGAIQAGVTLTLAQGGAALSTAVTGPAGTFSFADRADGDYTLTPTLSGYAFTPRSLAVTLGGADAPAQLFQAAVSAASSQIEELATGGHLAGGVAIGNDLDAWITDPVSGQVSRILLQDSSDGLRGDVMDIQLSPAGARPGAIALRYFGIRCFTEAVANRIGCLTWGGGTIFSADVPTPASGLVDIVNGPGATPLSPDMWFAEHDAGKVGRLSINEGGATPVATVVAEYALPAGCLPNALTWTDNNVWWAAEGCGRIGWIDRLTGAVHTIDVDVGRPVSLATNLGEPGAWFIDADGDRLGRVTTAGGLSWFTPAVPGSQLTGVTTGPDQALYVTQLAGNSIARLPFASYDPGAGQDAGRLTEELAIPTAGAQPARITAGTDGNVWFTERGQARLGVIYMPTHCIYGRITLADLVTPVASVAMTLTPHGGSSGADVTSAGGDYMFCGLAPGDYTVTPTPSARAFTPTSLAVTMGTSNLVGRGFVAR